MKDRKLGNGELRRRAVALLLVTSSIACFGDELQSPSDEDPVVRNPLDDWACADLVLDSFPVDTMVFTTPRCILMVGAIDTFKIDLIDGGDTLTGLRASWSVADGDDGIAVFAGDSVIADSAFLGIIPDSVPTDREILALSRLARVYGLRRGGYAARFVVDPELFEFQDFFIPVQVLERWGQISAASDHTCAVTYRDTLGLYPQTFNSPIPIALRAGGEVHCWGEGQFGALGNGQFAEKLAPTPVSSPLVFDKVSGGDDHTCGSEATGLLHCWGFNLSGQLGLGHRLEQFVPRLIDLAIPFGDFSAGDEFTCGIIVDRGAQFNPLALCWGNNVFGQLGCGVACPGDSLLSPDVGTPVLFQSNFLVVDSISAGGSHACASNIFGVTFCWGGNEYGQLGVSVSPDVCGATPCAREAVRIDAGQTFLTVSAGDDFTCGIDISDGTPYCWGRNHVGQLGDGTTDSTSTPTSVTGLPGGRFTTLVAGSEHACALAEGGAAFCWGANESGQLGDGSTSMGGSSQAVPVAGGIAFESLSAGSEHTCGVAADSVTAQTSAIPLTLVGGGGLYCWGGNLSGQLGDSTIVQRETPARVGEPPDPRFE